MTTFASEGFETGGYSAEWAEDKTAGETITVNAGDAHNGTFKCVCSSDGDAQGETSRIYRSIPETSVAYLRGYFKFSKVPTPGSAEYIIFCEFWANNNYLIYGWLDDIGGSLYWRIAYWNGAGQSYGQSVAVTVEANRWYCIEMYCYVHDVAGEIRLFVNEVEMVTVTSVDTNTRGGPIDEVRVGLIYWWGVPAQAYSVTIDDIVAADQRITCRVGDVAVRKTVGKDPP